MTNFKKILLNYQIFEINDVSYMGDGYINIFNIFINKKRAKKLNISTQFDNITILILALYSEDLEKYILYKADEPHTVKFKYCQDKTLDYYIFKIACRQLIKIPNDLDIFNNKDDLTSFKLSCI